jgi:hypothetical protein
MKRERYISEQEKDKSQVVEKQESSKRTKRYVCESDLEEARSKSKKKRKKTKSKKKGKTKKNKVKMVKDKDIAKSLIKKYPEIRGYENAVNSFLEENDINALDINDVTEGNFGYGIVLDTDDGEFWFLTDNEADIVAKEDVKDLIETEGHHHINGWEDFSYISPTDIRVIAGDEASNLRSDLEDDVEREDYDRLESESGENIQDIQDKIDEASSEERYEDVEKLEQERDDLIQSALDSVEEERYDYIKDALEKDAKGYFVDDTGIYSEEDYANASFVQVDYDELADYVIRSDGREHILARYDGIENAIGSDFVYYRVN